MKSGSSKPLLLIAGLLALFTQLALAQVPEVLTSKSMERLSAAERSQAEGDLNAAVIELKNALQEQPENAHLRYKIGLLYLDVGDGPAAEKAFERALKLGMSEFDVRLALARSWLLAGKYRDIITKLSEHQAPTASGKAAVNVLHGKAQLRMGEPEAARDFFRAALTALPQYSPAFVNLALLNLAEGDLDRAEVLMTGARDGVEIDRAEVQWMQGQLDYARGDYPAAENAFKASLATRPSETLRRALAAAQIQQGKHAEAEANLDRVLAVIPNEATAIYLKSLLAYLQKDFARAAEIASKLATDSGGSRAGFIAGASLFWIGSYEQAREYLSRFVAGNPDDLAGRIFLAQTLLRMDEADDAYSTLLPVSKRAAGNTGLLSLLGSAAIMSGRQGEGDAYLQEALDLRPRDAGLRARLAAIKAAAGDLEAGIAELERLQNEDTGIEGLGFALAKAHIIHTGAFDEAIAAVRRHRDQEPESSPEASLIEGFALIGQGDLEAAEKAFQQALAQKPNDPDAQTGLAEVRRQKGDIAGARQILEALLDTHPDPGNATLNLAVMEAKSGNRDQAIARLDGGVRLHPGKVDLQVALLRLLLQDGRLGDAVDLLDAWPDREDPRLLDLRGQVELLADRPQAAIMTYRRLVEARPESVDAHLSLAKAYHRGNEPEKAAKELDAAVNLDPGRVDTRIERNRFVLLRPNPKREETLAAVQDVLDLAKAYPTDAHVGELRGLVAWNFKRYEEAIALLKAAHAVLNTSESASLLAEIQWSSGKRDEGLQTIDDWVGQHPGDNYGRVRLAMLQLGAGEFQGAARNFEAALEAGVQRPDLEAVLAWSLIQAGRVEEAKPYAREAYAKSESNNPYALHAMGRVYLEEGNTADAVSLLRRALTHNAMPDPRLQIDYARALIATGKTDEARAVLDKLLANGEVFPNRYEASELRKRLEN